MVKSEVVTGYDLFAQNPEALEPGIRDFYGLKKFFPIAPADRLYLEAVGHGNDGRFASIFRDAWLKIPVADRKRMTDYWQDKERIRGVLGISIRMENLSGMRAREQTGVCEGPGIALSFFAPAIALMPPKHVAALVAHELAHVLQAANQTLTIPEKPEWMTDELLAGMAKDCGMSPAQMEAKLRYATNPVEHDADRIAKSWGFNTRAMSRWVSKHIDWDNLPEPPY